MGLLGVAVLCGSGVQGFCRGLAGFRIFGLSRSLNFSIQDHVEKASTTAPFMMPIVDPQPGIVNHKKVGNPIKDN